MGFFDLVQSALGRPDPSLALAQALGQAPGQPGGPPPVAGGPGSAPASPSPGAGASAGAQSAPQPQAYTTPSDLASMFVQLQQHQQNADQFNHGLALMAAGMFPGRRPDLIMNSVQNAPDAGSLINNMVRAQQFGYLQRQQQAFEAAIPDLVANNPLLTEKIIRAGGPDLMRQIVLEQAGIGGSPEMKSMRGAMVALATLNGGQPDLKTNTFPKGTPVPDWWGDPLKYAETVKAGIATSTTTAHEQAQDLTAAHSALPHINEGTDDAIARLDRILAAPNLANVLGPGALWTALKGGAGMGGADASLAKDINELGGQVYGTALGSEVMKGSRKTGAEAAGVASGLSQVTQTSQPEESYRFQLQLLRDKLMRVKANAAAAAGQQPSRELAGYEDPAFYDPGAPLAGKTPPKTFASRPTAGTVADTPSAAAQPTAAQPGAGPPDLRASKDPDGDYNKLPSGAVFIAPDGKQRRKP